MNDYHEDSFHDSNADGDDERSDLLDLEVGAPLPADHGQCGQQPSSQENHAPTALPEVCQHQAVPRMVSRSE